MAIRKRMAAHLGAHVTEDLIPLRPFVRETVMACGKCMDADLCDAWLTAGGNGTPAYCGAHDAFLRLAAAVQTHCEPEDAE